MTYDEPLAGEIKTRVYMYVCRACGYFVEYDCQCGYPNSPPAGYQDSWAGFANLEDAVSAQALISEWKKTEAA